jgi:molybdopterin/thiamine biosynthesis adenylyltransferase
MTARFLHEGIYRGIQAMDRIRNVSAALCGTGAVGSNLSLNLARQGVASFILIDHDRVEPHNLGTQIWSEVEVGLLKVECLRNRLFDELGLEAAIRSKKLTAQNADKLLQGATLIVDSFDNSASRQVVKEYALRNGIACLHVGLNGNYAEVIWNETYRVPSDAGQDVCDYPLARNLILLAVAVASECLVRYICGQEQKSYTITLGDFAVREL